MGSLVSELAFSPGEILPHHLEWSARGLLREQTSCPPASGSELPQREDRSSKPLSEVEGGWRNVGEVQRQVLSQSQPS